MSDAKITVRPDHSLLADLDALLAAGATSRAEAIRDAVRAAAQELRVRQAAEDALRLATDDADRAEMAIVRELMGTDVAW